MRKPLTRRDIRRVKEDYIDGILPAYLNAKNLAIRSFFPKGCRSVCVIRFQNEKFNKRYPTYLLIVWRGKGGSLYYKELARYPETPDKIRISDISLKGKTIFIRINCGPYHPKYLYQETMREKLH